MPQVDRTCGGGAGERPLDGLRRDFRRTSLFRRCSRNGFLTVVAADQACTDQ